MTSALLAHTIAAAYAPSGRINALALANELGMTTSEIAGALDKAPSTVRKYPDALSLQTELTRVMHIAQRLKHLFADNMDDVRIWLRAPHPQVHNVPPVQLLSKRRFNGLDTLLGAMEHGLP